MKFGLEFGGHQCSSSVAREVLPGGFPQSGTKDGFWHHQTISTLNHQARSSLFSTLALRPFNGRAGTYTKATLASLLWIAVHLVDNNPCRAVHAAWRAKTRVTSFFGGFQGNILTGNHGFCHEE